MKQQHNGLTLGKIRKFIEENQDLPDETPVLTERVEDKYFKNNGWGVLPIKGYHYYSALRMNKNMAEEIKRREKGEEWEYPNLKDPNELIASEEVLDGCKEQFFNSWCISRDNENEVVLIYNHY